MCQAKKIFDGASDARHAADMAEFDVMLQSAGERDGGRETVFIFTDGSELVISGTEYRWAK